MKHGVLKSHIFHRIRGTGMTFSLCTCRDDHSSKNVPAHYFKVLLVASEGEMAHVCAEGARVAVEGLGKRVFEAV